MTTPSLLTKREATHGVFAENSAAFAALVKAIPLERYDPMIWYEVVGIYIKLARMSSGNSTHLDHHEDIAGYATLVAGEIKAGRLK